MPKIKAELFTPVLAWLEAPLPDATGFHMGYFRATPNSCGTIQCIAGALVEFNPDVFPPHGNITLEQVAPIVGMTHVQGAALFYASDDPSYFSFGDLVDNRSAKNISRAEAVAAIRSLLTTGVVTWDTSTH